MIYFQFLFLGTNDPQEANQLGVYEKFTLRDGIKLIICLTFKLMVHECDVVAIPS
jgi:hypothetical protein